MKCWVLVSVIGLSGCYATHLGIGQYDLLSRREPMAGVLDNPTRDAELRRQLGVVRDARVFSVQALQLPDNDSYTDYADLARPCAVWNVFATPEFSLEGKTWCYPFAGCVTYRGYFDEARARTEAGDWEAQGWETHVGCVPAYSTLGWFDDPVLSSMLSWVKGPCLAATGRLGPERPAVEGRAGVSNEHAGCARDGNSDRESEDRLIETLFHELAHQQLFVEDDTAFNESFATFVGEEGLRQFRAARGEPPPDTKAASRERQFLGLLLAVRARLEAIYAQPLNHEAMRVAKQGEFARLRADYAALKKNWNGYAGYDGWFAGELNNAKLLPIGLYNQRVPEFAALFREVGGDWGVFYEKARALAKD